MLKAAIILVTLTSCLAQIVYQETDTNVNRAPQGHNRQPIISKKCGEGELLYPGDNAGDWTCDCKPGFLYYPYTSICYAAFTRGPCNFNELIVLPKSKSVPVCERNSCEEGKLRFENTCAKLESHEACKQPSANARSQRLYVDPTTLQLYCTFLAPSRFDEEDDGFHDKKECFVGGKRAQEGMCH